MPFRFRRSVRILPSLRLSASKNGLSTSVGKGGSRVTFGHGKTRATLGVPGTGLSYSTSTSGRRRKPLPGSSWWARVLIAGGVLAILWLVGWL